MEDFSLKPVEYFKNITYDIEDIYSSVPLCKLKKVTDNFKKNNVDTIMQELNNNYYRSDNFITEHIGNHILFAGDSYTFGSGMNIKETWPKILYEYIQKNERCSGYFNIGVMGNNTPNAITDIFKYCRTYGNPDVIFMSLTDASKFYTYDYINNFIANAIYDKNSINVLNVLQYQYYFMLEQYCQTNKIKLITISPADIDKKLTIVVPGKEIRKFKSFLSLDKKDCEVFMKSFIEINGCDYYSKDNAHMGLAFHTYLANKMYEYSLKIKEVD